MEQKDEGTGEWEEVTSSKTLGKRVGDFEKKFSFSKVDLDNHKHSRAKIFPAELLEEEDVARVTVHTFGEFGLHKEWIAAFILVGALSLITLEAVDRMLAAMIGSSLMLGLLALLGLTPTFAETVGFVDLGSLGLLFGMMIVVGTLSNTGVFEVTTAYLTKISRGSKSVLLFLLSSATALFSMWLDNVTPVLLIVPMTMTLCENINVNPVPFIISLIFFCNIGGGATVCQAIVTTF